MNERRALTRHRVFKAGTIEFDGIGVECTARNISEIGAGIEVPSPRGIPHEVTLNILSGGVRHPGHIVWRQERRLGVAFSSALPRVLR